MPLGTLFIGTEKQCAYGYFKVYFDEYKNVNTNAFIESMSFGLWCVGKINRFV